MKSILQVFAAATATLVGLTACPAGQTATNTAPPEVHIDFPLIGAHAFQGCQDCHVDGAAEQGLSSGSDRGWVDAISTDCAGCHTDTVQERFPNGHGGLSCSGGGCHSISDTCWAITSGGCQGTPIPQPTPPTGETPPPEPTPITGHEGDLAQLFPLSGPHDRGCLDCHQDPANYANEQGAASACSNCHTRADGPGAGHYPSLTGLDADRDCKSCHADELADGTLVNPGDWTTNAVVHDFLVPHNGRDACASCHTTPGLNNAQSYDCEACHPRPAIEDRHETTNIGTIACTVCHSDGQVP